MSYNETLERMYLRSIPQQGKVEWIGILPKRLLVVHSVNEVTANPDTGPEGDQTRKSSTGKRQVTLLQQEHLDVVARILGKSKIQPELLRRNIVFSDINLLALEHQLFEVGEILPDHRNLCSLKQNGRKSRDWRPQQHAKAWWNHSQDYAGWSDQDW